MQRWSRDLRHELSARLAVKTEPPVWPAIGIASSEVFARATGWLRNARRHVEHRQVFGPVLLQIPTLDQVGRRVWSTGTFAEGGRSSARNRLRAAMAQSDAQSPPTRRLLRRAGARPSDRARRRQRSAPTALAVVVSRWSTAAAVGCSSCRRSSGRSPAQSCRVILMSSERRCKHAVNRSWFG
jgi:hypothetical protein